MLVLPPPLLPGPFQSLLPLSLWWGSLGQWSSRPQQALLVHRCRQDPTSCPRLVSRRQSSGTSSSASQSFHCFLLLFPPRWKRARNNVSHCQHPSLPAGNDSVCMEARPLGRCASSKVWPQISLLPRPSEHPLPQNRRGGSVEVFLDFLDSF